MHFGMTGSLAYFKSPEEEPSHSRLLFAFENEDTHASNALSPSRDLTRLSFAVRSLRGPRGCRTPLKAPASILSICAGMHQRRRRRDRLCVGQRRLG